MNTTRLETDWAPRLLSILRVVAALHPQPQRLHPLEHREVEVDLERHSAVVTLAAAALREVAAHDEGLAESRRD